jgi:Na+-transporting NADH:ubiquinone oxidoreductase subunit C
MQHSAWYTILFAAAVCVICAILVSTSAVSLFDQQQANILLDKRKNVLLAAGILQADEKATAQVINERFAAVKPVVVDLRNGEPAPGMEAATFDQQKAKSDPTMSRLAPDNAAGVKRLPDYAVIYEVMNGQGEVEMIVLPVEGYGLWSTLYGFLALDVDTKTVRGLTYYQHGETPGLGGEVDNPAWKALWPGRIAYDEQWLPTIRVIKGKAGSASEDPHQVDGLSGATLTSRGVTNMLQFWLGENGFGPYLAKFREGRKVS